MCAYAAHAVVSFLPAGAVALAEVKSKKEKIIHRHLIARVCLWLFVGTPAPCTCAGGPFCVRALHGREEKVKKYKIVPCSVGARARVWLYLFALLATGKTSNK